MGNQLSLSTGCLPGEDQGLCSRGAGLQCGVGINFEVSDRRELIVESVVPGGAADKSRRVLAGDVLIAVDGVNIKGLDMSEISGKVLGRVGSSVTLDLRRRLESAPKGMAQRVTVRLVRTAAVMPPAPQLQSLSRLAAFTPTNSDSPALSPSPSDSMLSDGDGRTTPRALIESRGPAEWQVQVSLLEGRQLSAPAGAGEYYCVISALEKVDLLSASPFHESTQPAGVRRSTVGSISAGLIPVKSHAVSTGVPVVSSPLWSRKLFIVNVHSAKSHESGSLTPRMAGDGRPITGGPVSMLVTVRHRSADDKKGDTFCGQAMLHGLMPNDTVDDWLSLQDVFGRPMENERGELSAVRLCASYMMKTFDPNPGNVQKRLTPRGSKEQLFALGKQGSNRSLPPAIEEAAEELPKQEERTSKQNEELLTQGFDASATNPSSASTAVQAAKLVPEKAPTEAPALRVPPVWNKKRHPETRQQPEIQQPETRQPENDTGFRQVQPRYGSHRPGQSNASAEESRPARSMAAAAERGATAKLGAFAPPGEPAPPPKLVQHPGAPAGISVTQAAYILAPKAEWAAPKTSPQSSMGIAPHASSTSELQPSEAVAASANPRTGGSAPTNMPVASLDSTAQAATAQALQAKPRQSPPRNAPVAASAPASVTAQPSSQRVSAAKAQVQPEDGGQPDPVPTSLASPFHPESTERLQNIIRMQVSQVEEAVRQTVRMHRAGAPPSPGIAPGQPVAARPPSLGSSGPATPRRPESYQSYREVEPASPSPGVLVHLSTIPAMPTTAPGASPAMPTTAPGASAQPPAPPSAAPPRQSIAPPVGGPPVLRPGDVGASAGGLGRGGAASAGRGMGGGAPPQAGRGAPPMFDDSSNVSGATQRRLEEARLRMVRAEGLRAAEQQSVWASQAQAAVSPRSPEGLLVDPWVEAEAWRAPAPRTRDYA